MRRYTDARSRRSSAVATMHELSVAVDLIEIASAELATLGSRRATAVHLRVGPLSGVVKEALAFSFEVAVVGTPLDGVRLNIEDVPVTIWCEPCAAERELEDLTRRRCPVCASVSPRVIRGYELELVSLEIEDA